MQRTRVGIFTCCQLAKEQRRFLLFINVYDFGIRIREIYLIDSEQKLTWQPLKN